MLLFYSMYSQRKSIHPINAEIGEILHRCQGKSNFVGAKIMNFLHLNNIQPQIFFARNAHPTLTLRSSHIQQGIRRYADFIQVPRSSPKTRDLWGT